MFPVKGVNIKEFLDRAALTYICVYAHKYMYMYVFVEIGIIFS